MSVILLLLLEMSNRGQRKKDDYGKKKRKNEEKSDHYHHHNGYLKLFSFFVKIKNKKKNFLVLVCYCNGTQARIIYK